MTIEDKCPQNNSVKKSDLDPGNIKIEERLPNESRGNSNFEATTKILKENVKKLIDRLAQVSLGTTNRYINTDDPNYKRLEERRQFIKIGLAIAGATALGGTAVKLTTEYLKNINDEESLSGLPTQIIKKYHDGSQQRGITHRINIQPLEINNNSFYVTTEQDKIEKEDSKALKAIFVKQFIEKGSVSLSLDSKREMQQYWKDQYTEGGPQYLGLIQSLNRLKMWYEEIKTEFQNVSKTTGVQIPERLIYLAIPESHCQIEACSSAMAKGYYQLMSNTARGDKKTVDGLIVRDDGLIDERLDVPENARRAAEYLVELYQSTKTSLNTEDNAWRLALARYNGSYYKKYQKNVSNKEHFKKYSMYLEYRELRINKFLQDAFRVGYFVHEIAEDNLGQMAIKFQTTVESIKRQNKLTSDVIHKGRDIKIPINTNNVKEKEKTLNMLANTYLADSFENLNYPEKFFAIYEVIEELGLLIKDVDDTESLPRIKGDNKTLKEISRERGVLLENLRIVNPHIKTERIRMPDRVEVNIPTKISKIHVGKGKKHKRQIKAALKK